MESARVLATYRIETPYPLDAALALLAGEQSTGTFVRLPGETDALRERFGARIEHITDLGTVESPSIPVPKLPPGLANAKAFRRAEVILSWSIENMGPSLPNLLATVAGNLFELREFSGLRLMDITLPPAFAETYAGPAFGIQGTRRLSGVYDRPLIGTIVKPSIGMSPEETAALVQTLVEAGLDFIKDDELMANPPHSPLPARVKAVMQVINQHADRTGKKVMYAFNVTDEIDTMRRHHDAVLEAGGTCVMVSINSMGVPAIAHLRRYCQLPIHGHRNGWGYMTRDPWLGMEFTAYQKFWRLAGVDHIHTNGLRNKFYETDESVTSSIRACLTPMFSDDTVMPVLSAGQWAGQAPDTYRIIGSVDLMYLCGGGIMAHPGGIAAGVASVRQGWEAALAGKSLEEYAQNHLELRQSIERYAS